MKLIFVVTVMLTHTHFLQAHIDDKTESFKKLMTRVENKNLNMNERWAALMKATQVARGREILEIKKFSDHEQWYLRNAALVALNKVNRDEALVEARKLLSDKALVVRSAAVEVIAQRLTTENKQLLQNELNKPYNFHKKSSLWIRAQIVQQLSEKPDQQDRSFFVKALFDQDKEVARLSAQALEKMTGEKLNQANFVESWRNYARTQNWL